MKYYAERKGLLENDLKIDFQDLKEYFIKVYRYFDNRNCFKAAIDGIWIKPRYEDKRQILAPLFEGGAEVFFLTHIQSTSIYPIYEYYEDYTETELFTLIEILYDKIGVYNYDEKVLEQVQIREEFATLINNILKFYEDGYFLEPSTGIITKGANDAVKMMLSEDLHEVLNEDIMSKLREAVKMYYRFDANLESKKKAINILADILEPLRTDLKNVLNETYEINKADHDNLIFQIVNQFNIRHNNARQYTHYEHEIWYDWMIQYYTSVIITYYKLKQKKS